MKYMEKIISFLEVEASDTAKFTAGGKWSVGFPAENNIKFGTALRGEYWLKIGNETPQLISMGDAYLLVNSQSYVVSSEPNLNPVDGKTLYKESENNCVYYGGEDVIIIGVGYSINKQSSSLLLDMLPKVILMKGNTFPSLIFKETLNILDKELQTKNVGSSMIANRLGEVLLMQVLREYIQNDQPVEWLKGLNHSGVRMALELMHGNISKSWTVDMLAKKAGMSRSSFAKNFKEQVGDTPLEYLLRWRMFLAREALKEGKLITNVAQNYGYSSVSAFGHAFKRIFGYSPGKVIKNNKVVS